MRLMLAPMEGVIDHTMRELLSELGGMDRCVTEFVRVSEALLPARVFRRLCPELGSGGTTASGVPVYLQLLGGQPTPMAENAARAAELGAPGIDLNFGCPAKTVNRSDGGSIRLGFEDQSTFLDVVQGIAEANATELTIHARTKKHGYRAPAYWEEIARARSTVSLPIIANGEIWSPGDALRSRQQSQCQDLMLGRGALCRPDLPRLVRAALDGTTIDSLNWTDILPLLRKLLSLNLANYDASYVAGPIKQWLVYLRYYYPQAAVMFESIKRERDPERIEAILEQCSQSTHFSKRVA